ncbi:hypothetical protein GGE68_005906 [Rhizobium leguminosarum]|uniref:hypothetical protein n=1 Tax=Rhizobium leguminosarum TaxID=384 RepID=UPI0017C9B0D9|nr:hypothetical protein [Rhizobium leguminosarum]MBB5667657.1 hypothetical protein [Rhizobium leguminosarum]
MARVKLEKAEVRLNELLDRVEAGEIFEILRQAGGAARAHEDIGKADRCRTVEDVYRLDGAA